MVDFQINIMMMKNINKFLKDIEKESVKCYMNIFIKSIKELMKIFIILKEKIFSRILQDYENQLLMNLV